MVVIGCAFVAWSAVSAQLTRWNITGPIFFMLVGLTAAMWPLQTLRTDLGSEDLRLVAELALAVTLFSDASRVNHTKFKPDVGIAVRLLGIGLPLTIATGIGVGWLLFPGISIWVVATLAAAVAPTDAALGAAVMEDKRVSRGVRDVINVESGLNDGIATPFLTFFVAAAVTTSGVAGNTVADAARELIVGLVVGAAIGFVGGKVLRWGLARGSAEAGWAQIAALALALTAYAGAIGLNGNGFIAAFVAGYVFGWVSPDDQGVEVAYANRTGGVLGLVAWFLFGCAIIVPSLKALSWREVVFAVLALTVFRMVPVAVALIGSGLRWTTVAFIGWFGPRGLATIVFGLIAFDSFSGTASSDVLSAVTLTIVLSVAAHGLTAGPLGKWFGSLDTTDWLSGPDDGRRPQRPKNHRPRRDGEYAGD